jgi:AAA ATPase domain
MAPELVGRDPEIAVVESLLAGIAGGGGSLLVLGDPGIGKSALVEAAARHAADAGMRVLVCAGVPSEAQFSFAGLHQLLRPVLADADSLPRGVWLYQSTRNWLIPGQQPVVQFGGEGVNLAGQLRVGFELQFFFGEVVVGLGLLEGRLPVLADHDKGGQEDRFQRDDQRQRRPRLGFDQQHPDREQRDVDVDEAHRPGEGGDPVGDPQLNVLGPLFLLLQDNRVAPKRVLQRIGQVFDLG